MRRDVEDRHASATTGASANGPEASLPGHDAARSELARFAARLTESFWDDELGHTLRQHLDAAAFDALAGELQRHADLLAATQPLVAANDARASYPQLEPYDGIGRRTDDIVHHGAYADVGDVIYGSGVVRRLVAEGGLREGYAFHYLNCMLGEAGHNCPVICNFETARLLERHGSARAEAWRAGLMEPAYRLNLTASQFLTEVTGGSDVGANATVAWRDDDGAWRIRGEKWFTSNADADLNVITARFDSERPGTRGLSVFLVPRRLPDGSRNAYTLRRLKEKLGTRALATAEIDYHDAWALPLADDVERGFNVMMEEVVHHSRIALSVSCVAMAARAYQVARAYAAERTVFGRRVIDHALARENLASIRAHVLAMQAGLWRLIAMQDAVDLGRDTSAERRGFIRLMSNAYKQVTSQACVDHCHHALDTLGGNGTIETFSPLPRLLRDAVIEENWEGTHNTVRAQVLRDLLRYDVDRAYVSVMHAEVEALSEHRAEGRERLALLEHEFGALRTESGDVQSLRMQALIRDLVNVAAWTALAAEVEANPPSPAKRGALELFELQHLDGNPRGYDDTTVAVIDATIGHGAARRLSQMTRRPRGSAAPVP